jgi:hypothetical protein
MTDEDVSEERPGDAAGTGERDRRESGVEREESATTEEVEEHPQATTPPN